MPSDATFDTTPQAPQTIIVTSENASQRGIPRILGMAARDVVAVSDIISRAGHFQHHLQRNSGIMAHALHRFLPSLQWHADRPRGQINFAGNQKIE